MSLDSTAPLNAALNVLRSGTGTFLNLLAPLNGNCFLYVLSTAVVSGLRFLRDDDLPEPLFPTTIMFGFIVLVCLEI